MTAPKPDTEPFGEEATTYDLLGGDTWRFDERGPLIGIYAGSDLRDTQYAKDRELHHFVDDDEKVWDVWGGTGLNKLLEDHIDHRVRVTRTEDFITTTRGRQIRIWRVACAVCK